MSDAAPDDAEARLIAVIERILRVVPHVLESEDERENAEVAANYALATLWELRLDTPEGSPKRRRYEELVRLLQEWRDG